MQFRIICTDGTKNRLQTLSAALDDVKQVLWKGKIVGIEDERGQVYRTAEQLRTMIEKGEI